jgi:uncharacterized protein (DUF427 family)
MPQRQENRMKALWNNKVIAQSDAVKVVEGNHYFPKESIHQEYFVQTSHTSFCPWKGSASYFTITVDGVVNENGAWCYAEPKEAADKIKGYVAFWNGVQVID